MKLSVIVATLEGCSFSQLDDAEYIASLLDGAVAAGGLTLLHKHVHKFEPQGVTAAAVLSESHIAVHTWPEHGLLFVDIATCSTAAATRAAFEHICKSVSHRSVLRRVWSLAPALESQQAAPAQPPLLS